MIHNTHVRNKKNDRSLLNISILLAVRIQIFSFLFKKNFHICFMYMYTNVYTLYMLQIFEVHI